MMPFRTWGCRFYKDEADKSQITEMCKNVFEGTDRLPHIVSLLAEDDACLPLVATHGQDVVAFCNLRRLESDDDTNDVFLFERMRVTEANRRRGVGTALVREAMKVGEAWCGSERCTRFLSTTIQRNLGMVNIFKKTGWACSAVVEMWPSYAEGQKLMKTRPDISGRFLDALQLSAFIPPHAVESISAWQKVETPGQVWNAVRSIQAQGGCMVIPGFYAVETVSNAVKLTIANGQSDTRSVWKMDRGISPPILLFVQKANADRLDPLPCDLLSAVVVDIAGAESCVAFAASRNDLGAFAIAFDPALTKDKMKDSTLLSKVDTSTFVIYETSN